MAAFLLLAIALFNPNIIPQNVRGKLGPYKQPFPQQPHQGRSLVRARSLADLSAFELLFELLLLLLELLGKVESASSGPDSGSESSLEDLLFPDLLLGCFSLLFLDFLEWWCWPSADASLLLSLLLFFPSCSFCDAPGPGRDRFKCVVVAVDVGGGAVDGTMSSPGTLPFLKMPLTVFEVAIAARDRLDWPEHKKT